MSGTENPYHPTLRLGRGRRGTKPAGSSFGGADSLTPINLVNVGSATKKKSGTDNPYHLI